MQHDAAFHQGLHCLLRLKQPSGTEIYHNLENSTYKPLVYIMGSSILIVSRSVGKSIQIQRVEAPLKTASENVVYLSHLLHIFDNYIGLCKCRGKQCRPRSDCFYRGILIWTYTLCQKGSETFQQTAKAEELAIFHYYDLSTS